MAKGHFYTENLVKLRAQLHSNCICPKVMLNGVGAVKSLRVQDAVIHRALPESTVCQEFANIFNRLHKRELVYRGQTIATFANEAFQELCRPPVCRRKVTETQQAIIWARQGSVCNLCGSASAQTNVDHICPRFAGGEDVLDNLQVICANCHTQKTTLECLSIVEDDNPLLSRFSLET